MRKIVVLVLVLAVIPFALFAGGKQEVSADDGLTFGFAGWTPKAESHLAIEIGMKNYAEKLGIKLLVNYCDEDTQKQIGVIDNYITQNVDAIIIVPADSKAVGEVVKKADAAGIPCYSVDRGIEGPIQFTVMSDNFMAGAQAGEELVKGLKKIYNEPKGTILELLGDMTADIAHERRNGFHSTVDQYPNITVIEKPTKWDPVTAGEVTQDVLSSEDIDAIYYASDYTGAGVIPVIESTGNMKKVDTAGHIYTCGIDGTTIMFNYIREKKVASTVNQPLTDFGLIVQIAYEQIVEGKEYKAGDTIESDAFWSPAVIEDSEYGLNLLLSTIPVDASNVDNPAYWANQVSR